MDRHEIASAFFARLDAHDVDGALSLVSPDADATLFGHHRAGDRQPSLREYIDALVTAFPTLVVKLRSLFVTTDGTAVAEITLDGVQADDFLGIVNQEKYLDVDQAWLLHINDDGVIDHVRAYWCQNQVYRRLAVKRLDRVTITAV